jgi:hypothetical protein
MIERIVADRSGKKVKVGDRVRLVALEYGTVDSLLPGERSLFTSMLRETFEVEEIDKYGSAWIYKWWNRGDGKSESHALALSAVEMELAESENAS